MSDKKVGGFIYHKSKMKMDKRSVIDFHRTVSTYVVLPKNDVFT